MFPREEYTLLIYTARAPEWGLCPSVESTQHNGISKINLKNRFTVGFLRAAEEFAKSS